MSTPEDGRKFKRFFLPVVIQAPGISDFPLVPEDVSAGGFKVLVTTEPNLNVQFECSIQISSEVFDDCQATAAWAHDNGDGTWYAGITIHALSGDRDFLELTLSKADEDLN